MRVTDTIARSHALRITFIYLVFASAWIFFSDRLLDTLSDNTALLTYWQSIKGVAFVIITSVMLYLLISGLRQAPDNSQESRVTQWVPSLVFLLLVVCIGLMGWRTYSVLRQNIQQDIQKDLSSVGHLKKNQIEVWLSERLADASVASRESFLAQATSHWLKSHGAQKTQLQNLLKDRLNVYIQHYHYRSITLLDLQGRVMLSAGGEPLDLGIHRTSALQAVHQNRTMLVDLHVHPTGKQKKPSFGVVSPLSFEGVIIGAILFTIDPDQFLFPALLKDVATTRTDESFLIRLEGRDVEILNPQAHLPVPVWTQSTEHFGPELFEEAISRGNRGLLTAYTDHKNKRVMAYATGIANTPWVLVTKMDEDEAYQKVRQLASVSGFVTLVLLLLGGTIILLWWQRERNRHAASRAQLQLEQEVLSSHYDYLSRYANDVIILTDDSGHFIQINERAMEVYGYSHEEMLGMTMSDLRMDEPAVYINSEVLDSTVGLIYESRQRRKDGSTFTAEVSARMIEEQDHYFVHMVIRDISERKQAELALYQSERRFRRLFESAPVALGYATSEGHITLVNRKFEQLFGYTLVDLPTLQDWYASAYPDETYRALAVKQWTEACMPGPDIRPDEYRITCKDGRVREVLISGITFDHDALVSFQDITEHKHSEKRIRRLTQLYATLSRINETIVHMGNENKQVEEDKLFQQVCEIAVAYGGIAMAWMGRIDPPSRRIIPVAHAGHGSDYLRDIVISSDESVPEGRGPTGTAFRSGKPYYNQDFLHNPAVTPWLERAKKFGWKASAAIPVPRDGQPYAVLTLYHEEAHPFDEEASGLLQEIANDLSFALDTLDIRAESLANLDKLQTANFVIENSPSIIWRRRAETGWPTEYVSENIHQLGYAPEDFTSGGILFTSIIHPDDIKRVSSVVEAHGAAGEDHFQQEYRILHKNGEIRWLRDDTVILRDRQGHITHYQGVTSDITQLHEAQSRSERLGVTLDKSINEIYLFAVDTLHFVQVNESARRNLGYSMEELANMTPLDITPEFTADRFARLAAPLLSGERASIVFETLHRRKDGSEYPVEIHLQMMIGDQPVFLALGQDITDRKHAEESLRQSTQHFQAYFEAAPFGMAATSLEKGWLEVNNALCELLGYSREELSHMTWAEITHPEDLSMDEAEFQRILNGEIDGYTLDKRFIRKDGTIVPTHIAIRCLRRQDGSVDYFVALVEDITERMQALQKIEYLAHFDPLTGLPNRTLLNDRVENLLQVSTRSKSELALLFLDLDRFKNVNDSLGHDIGDKLLMQVGQRLTQTLRDEDTVSRMGGDEFVALLPSTNTDGAAHVASKILQVLSRAYHIDNYELNISASLGIAMFPENGQDFASLSRSADSALYRAKQGGRNCYQFFTDEMHRKALRTLEIEGALRRALDKNELVLHYQPQVNLESGRIIGAEALVRWQHPEWGLTPPGDFIQIAEESGMIADIGDWVLREAIRQNRAWQLSGLAIVPVAVNLSMAQFRQSTLLENVRNMMNEFSLAPEYIELELTESIAMENIALTIETVSQLHQFGTKLSIDDFGTGYSSLSYLKRFAIDKLKIDQSFIRHLSEDANDEAIVIAIINMAKSLGFKVIAEGVETAEQLAFLRARQCDEIQGYLFSRPIPPEEFAKMLAEGARLVHNRKV